MNDEVEVKLSDLSSYSSALVCVKCDYCGCEYRIKWSQYYHRSAIVNHDACQSCCEVKAREAISLKYGGYKELHAATEESRRATNIKRYGTANPFGSEVIKRKIIKTNLKKYGCEYNQQNPQIHNKTVKTCLEKYGVSNYIELFKGRFIKEHSPVWKGGVKYSRVERATYEYGQWRSAVYVRDKYTCQKCGAHTGCGRSFELNAHHIYNWKDNPQLRYDVNNGITLCDSCHTQFHIIYGKSHNTPKQLREFLNNSDEKVC